MMKRFSYFSIILMIVFFSVSVSAQETISESDLTETANLENIEEKIENLSDETAGDAVKYKEAVSLLNELNALDESQKIDIKEITDSLKGTIKNIDQAEAIFDRMIESRQRVGSLGKPDNDFVKSLEELAIRADKDATDAYAAGATEFGDRFKKSSEFFMKARDEAIKMYSDSFRDIRSIKEQKQSYVWALKLEEYEAAAEIARRGLDMLEENRNYIAKVKELIPADDAAAESQ
jgi:tetratricopeptide (TPR) repeat protein